MAADVTQWKCNLEGADALTVGDVFSLSCFGPPTQIDQQKIGLRRPKEFPYLLKILKVDELTQTTFKAQATTYTASEKPYDVAGYGITDGQKTIEFVPFRLTVKSVITQENNPENKPFPAYGPVPLSYPLWIWIALAVVGIALVALFFRFFRLGRQRRAFLQELKDRSSALSPYHQFQKELRQIARTLPLSHQEEWQPPVAQKAIESLDSSYRWFLAREFKVPAHQWSANLVHREVKKIDRKLFKKAQKQLEISDRELRRARKNFSIVSLQDFQQLLEIVRKAADLIRSQRTQENLR